MDDPTDGRQELVDVERLGDLEEGVAGTAMIAFTFLPEEERWALAYYVLEPRARGKAAGKGSTK